MSNLEKQLYFQIKHTGLPIPIREFRFAAEFVGLGAGIKRRLHKNNLKDWRADFCWPDMKLLVEVEGGGYSYGRHNRPTGFAADLVKYQAAMRMGYNVYRCDGELVKNGEALKTIEILMRLRPFEAIK